MSAPASTVTLIAKDGFSVTMDVEKARISGVVKVLLDENDSDNEVVLPKVTQHELQQIVEFMDLYAASPLPTIPQPLPTNDLSRVLPPSYGTYILAMSEEEVTSLINAADFMDISPLLHLCAARIATFFYGKTREEIKAMLNIVNAGGDETE